MSGAGGGWRNSSAYDFVDALAPEQVPFEFLRRNPEYLAEYPTLAAEPTPELPPPALTRWGLRFRSRPQHSSGGHAADLAAASEPASRGSALATTRTVRWTRDADGSR